MYKIALQYDKSSVLKNYILAIRRVKVFPTSDEQKHHDICYRTPLIQILKG